MKFAASSTDVPEGCSVQVVSESVSVHMNTKGLVDVAAEIAKLQKKLTQVQKQIDTINKKVSAAGYETKVPENVRAGNAERLQRYTAEREQLLESIQSFKNME